MGWKKESYTEYIFVLETYSLKRVAVTADR